MGDDKPTLEGHALIWWNFGPEAKGVGDGVRMTPIERVARAIAGSVVARAPETIVGEVDWGVFVPAARAAILALREPSREMVAAASVLEMRAGTDPTILEVWRWMIDAALAEAGDGE